MRFSTLITPLFSFALGFAATQTHANPKSGSGTPQRPSETSATKRILAFGDSLTAGYRLPSSQAYPAQLEALLKKDGIPASVTNAGVSGDTSAQALRRVDWSLKHGNYDLVLLCIGANDGLRQLPVKELESNLRKIAEKFRKAGVQVILIGMRLPSNYSEDYRKAFEAVYARVAADLKLDFIPFFLDGVAMEDLLNLDDRIHPNANGHKIIAQRLATYLKPKL